MTPLVRSPAAKSLLVLADQCHGRFRSSFAPGFSAKALPLPLQGSFPRTPTYTAAACGEVLGTHPPTSCREHSGMRAVQGDRPVLGSARPGQGFRGLRCCGLGSTSSGVALCPSFPAVTARVSAVPVPGNRGRLHRVVVRLRGCRVWGARAAADAQQGLRGCGLSTAGAGGFPRRAPGPRGAGHRPAPVPHPRDLSHTGSQLVVPMLGCFPERQL